MKTKTIKLYEYSELSKEVKKKALAKWNETNDNPIMQSHMINLLKEKLDERGIKYDVDSIDVRYSLSYSQGDGFMFEGIIEWEGAKLKIKHSGRYYHSYSKNVEEIEQFKSENQAVAFEKVYQAICKEMEQAGYDEIEYQQSEEMFVETCEISGYTFRENGVMENL